MNPNAMTAAHKTLPFGSKVRVVDQRTGKSIMVTINDRGPFIKGRIIDLSKRSADAIGFRNQGTANVRVQLIGPARHKRMWGYATAAFALMQAVSGYFMAWSYAGLGSYQRLFVIGSVSLLLGTLMGLILAAMAVELLADGLMKLFPALAG